MSKTSIKWLATLLSVIMMVSLLGACQETQPKEGEESKAETTAAPETSAEETTAAAESSEETTTEAKAEETTKEEASSEEAKAEETEERESGTLVVGMSEFTEKFSPFYATTAYDREIADLCSISLLGTDRAGEIVYKGIEGEKRVYNGTEYEYPGIADVEVKVSDEKDENGSPKDTVYTFTIKDDLKFSDGEPITMDDVMFTIYAFLDPSYTGSSTLSTLPIVGLQEYRTQTNTAMFEKYEKVWKDVLAAGPGADKNAGEGFTAEQYDKIWSMIGEKAKEGSAALYDMMAGMISEDYVKKAFGEDTKFTEEEVKGDEGLAAAFALKMWNLASIEDNHLKSSGKNEAGEDVEIDIDLGAEDRKISKDDVYNVGRVMYGSNDFDYAKAELADFVSMSDVKDAFINEAGQADPEAGEASEGVTHVEGIKKIDDTHFSITLKGFDASAIYKIGTYVTPLHYYGNKDLYDYDAGKFGFPFKDLSSVEAKTKHPMGAGPYIFQKYEKKIVYLEANPHYWKGEPKIKHLQYKATPEKDKIAGITSGIIDITDPSFSKERADEIKGINDGELVGKTITTSLVDNLGYGYIGICAKNVKVGDDPGSEESKALRKALATILAEERALAVDSFYGEAASVINYPISNTSWAAPKPGDEGYQVAFSVDPDGNAIYTDKMDEKEKREAAKNTAIEYFKKAGYTYDEASGKLTAAPEGAKLQYTIIVPGEGTGDHPSFKLITEARNVLGEIGFTLDINDPAQVTVLWDTLDAGTQELWCAAWQATPDPDMYQIYHSSSIKGAGGTENNHYCIADPELDELIIEARESADQEFRKTVYKTCLDILIDWAVEVPVYQRQNCIIFSSERVNMDTITPEITTFWGWGNDIQSIETK